MAQMSMLSVFCHCWGSCDCTGIPHLRSRSRDGYIVINILTIVVKLYQELFYCSDSSVIISNIAEIMCYLV